IARACLDDLDVPAEHARHARERDRFRPRAEEDDARRRREREADMALERQRACTRQPATVECEDFRTGARFAATEVARVVFVGAETYAQTQPGAADAGRDHRLAQG